MSSNTHVHGKGNGKILRKTREKLNARRNAFSKMSSDDQRAERMPGSMKLKQ